VVTIHISAAEAARDFPSLLARVREGAEVIIEDGAQTVAVLRSPAPPRRSISESIALAEAHSRELGYKSVMDADFAADIEERIRNRKPSDRSAWDTTIQAMQSADRKEGERSSSAEALFKDLDI
jgi:antitoxin (DNA-binding transcriptional repressor) of toxin-antitoxin stability system